MAQRWYESMRTNIGSALELEQRIQQFMEHCIVPYIQVVGYSNQDVDKFMAAVGGWTRMSPRLRWPYRWVPEEEIAAVRKYASQLLPEFFPTQIHVCKTLRRYGRSVEQKSELQSLMCISYDVFCLKKKINT